MWRPYLSSTRALLWFFLPQALHGAKCTAFSGLHSGRMFVSVGRLFVTLSLVTIWHPLQANSHWKVDWNRGSAHKSMLRRSCNANTGVSLWPRGTGREESVHTSVADNGSYNLLFGGTLGKVKGWTDLLRFAKGFTFFHNTYPCTKLVAYMLGLAALYHYQ